MGKRTKRTGRARGLIKVGGEFASDFITMAVLLFVFEGDHEGVKLARHFQDAEGTHPPIDDMISMVLVDEGRLLTAGEVAHG